MHAYADGQGRRCCVCHGQRPRTQLGFTPPPEVTGQVAAGAGLTDKDESGAGPGHQLPLPAAVTAPGRASLLPFAGEGPGDWSVCAGAGCAGASLFTQNQQGGGSGPRGLLPLSPCFPGTGAARLISNVIA